jgi:hypothetical protein
MFYEMTPVVLLQVVHAVQQFFATTTDATRAISTIAGADVPSVALYSESAASPK